MKLKKKMNYCKLKIKNYDFMNYEDASNIMNYDQFKILNYE